jgi:two-component system OmpR family sensor kinase
MSSARGIGRTRARLRAVSDRVPLWGKLITAVLTLVLVALVVISVAGASVLKNYLLGQADDNMQSLISQVNHQTFRLGNTRYLDNEAAIWVPDSGQSQNLLTPVSPGYGLPGTQPQPVPGPVVPADVASLPSTASDAITVPATSGGGLWRVVGLSGTVTNQDGSQTNGTIVLAYNVTGTYAAIAKLRDIDLIVGAIVILGLAAVGIAVVRASLRPLTDIEQTAAAIAAGDLSSRVPDRDPRTEVGRLGRSLNTMLAQIETAFQDRTRSEEAARRSERRMRQFVADASHELRTPLTAIRGFAEYYRQRGGVGEVSAASSRAALGRGGAAALEAGPAEPGTSMAARTGAYADPDRTGPLPRADLDRIMQRVEQESSRMGVLVEDMLLLARLDQQRPLDRGTVDMLTLAADAVHDARVVAPSRSIDLSVGSGAALLVVGDEIRLRQVIGNLMSNALNHTPEGTPIEVRVRLGSLDEWRAAASAASASQTAFAVAKADVRPFPAVILEVADRGSGLTPEQAEHVFERFYRGDQARTRRSGGTGLGLAIVAALVSAHDGAVWVESPPGYDGAIFRIALPLAPEARYAEPEFDDEPADVLDSRGRPLTAGRGPTRHARPASPPPPAWPRG